MFHLGNKSRNVYVEAKNTANVDKCLSSQLLSFILLYCKIIIDSRIFLIFRWQYHDFVEPLVLSVSHFSWLCPWMDPQSQLWLAQATNYEPLSCRVNVLSIGYWCLHYTNVIYLSFYENPKFGNMEMGITGSIILWITLN